MSDIVLILADSRFPNFHFVPSLQEYVEKMGKKFILVLTKTDLVPPEVVERWEEHFLSQSRKLSIATVAAQSVVMDASNMPSKGKIRRKQVKIETIGTDDLLECIKEVAASIGREISIEARLPGGAKGTCSTSFERPTSDKDRDGYSARKALKVGMIGHPNVGKSSLINALMGRKKVSVSKTPGHTKYFQTLFLNPTLMLVDCPGLVFPALNVPYGLQVLGGVYPIAQLREPYTSIQFLAEYVPLEELYKLPIPPDASEDTYEWTAWDICEQRAEQRGFFTKGGRPDTYRAANEILRSAHSGEMEIYFDLPELATPKVEEEKTNSQLTGGQEDAPRVVEVVSEDGPTTGEGATEDSPAQAEVGASWAEIAQDTSTPANVVSSDDAS